MKLFLCHTHPTPNAVKPMATWHFGPLMKGCMQIVETKHWCTKRDIYLVSSSDWRIFLHPINTQRRRRSFLAVSMHIVGCQCRPTLIKKAPKQNKVPSASLSKQLANNNISMWRVISDGDQPRITLSWPQQVPRKSIWGKGKGRVGGVGGSDSRKNLRKKPTDLSAKS